MSVAADKYILYRNKIMMTGYFMETVKKAAIKYIVFLRQTGGSCFKITCNNILFTYLSIMYFKINLSYFITI